MRLSAAKHREPFNVPRSRDLVFGLGRKNDFRYFKSLLKRGTDPTASDAAEGWTLLHFAVFFDNLKAAKLIIKAGAHVSAADNDLRSTPLHFAQSSKMVRLLLDAGADPVAQNRDGDTPFDIAVMFDNFVAVRILLHAGIVNATSQQGARSCLHSPMLFGRADLVTKLMELGVDPWQGCTFEDMPWYGARRSSRHAVIAYLLRTVHDTKASHGNTPKEFVRQLILGKLHDGNGMLNQDDFPAIAKLINDELRIRYPPPSPTNATISQAHDGSPSPQTNDELQSPCDVAVDTHKPPPLETRWASGEVEEAYKLQFDLFRLLAATIRSITALFNNSNKFQGDMQFMKRKRPPCLSMPWTIWPALVVLWGVCWMFIYSPVPEDLSWVLSSGNDGSTFGLDNLGFWNEVFDGSLSLPDPALDVGAQGIGTEGHDVFPTMLSLSVGAQPRVSAARASDYTNPDWDWAVRCTASQATSHPIPTGNSHQSQLVEIAPRAPGLTAGLGTMAGISSEAVQKQTSWQCDSCSSRFGRRTTLLRHQREQHGPSDGKKKYFCPRRGCKHHVNGQGFARKDQLNRHLRRAEYCRSKSASTRPVGEQRQGQQAPPQDDDEESAPSFRGSPLSPASTVQEQSIIDPNAYMDRLLRSTLAALTAEEQECEAEEREAMAEFARRKKRIKVEKRQAQAALDAFDGPSSFDAFNGSTS